MPWAGEFSISGGPCPERQTHRVGGGCGISDDGRETGPHELLGGVAAGGGAEPGDGDDLRGFDLGADLFDGLHLSVPCRDVRLWIHTIPCAGYCQYVIPYAG
jgi:hypothetical protein